MYRYLGKNVTEVLNFLHQFHANRTALAFQADLLKDTPADQAKITIHVTQMDAESKAYKIVIQLPNDFADERIMVCNLIAIDRIHSLTQCGHEIYKFKRIVLRIAIGIEDPFFGCGRKTAAQCCTITEVLLMMKNFQLRITMFQLAQNLASIIGAAIVGDNDLKIISHLT